MTARGNTSTKIDVEFFSPSHLDSSSPVKRESVARIDYFPDGYIHRSDDHHQKHVNSSHRRHLQQPVTSKSTSSQSRFRQSSQVKSSQSTRLCRTNDHYNYKPTPAMKKPQHTMNQHIQYNRPPAGEERPHLATVTSVAQVCPQEGWVTGLSSENFVVPVLLI